MKLGFVGTGTITEAIVIGIMGSTLPVSEIVISPRNVSVAARLAARFPAVRVAANNQEVVDAGDILFLAIRPQIAEEVVRGLRFRPDQTIISVIAATDRDKLRSWIDQDVRLTQAIPLPFVADRDGVTAIYPADQDAASVFSALGTAVECETRDEYDLLAVASALMGTYFGLLERTTNWLVDKGMPAPKAQAYLAPLFASLSQAAVRSGNIPFGDMRREFSTEGGLNEQVFNDFDRKGGRDALTEALDGVFARIKG